MDVQSILIPVFSLVGVALGGGLQYTFGRALESRKQLVSQRSQSYVDYFKAVSLISIDGASKENRILLADAKSRICLYGSPDVINSLKEFEETGSVINSREAQMTIIEVVRSMRQDVGRDNLIPDEYALQKVLFGNVR